MMEHFSEIYGDCYRAVAAVLALASARPLSEQEITDTVERYSSCENALYIVPRLTSGQWPLLRKEGDGRYSSVTKHSADMPLTRLQRAWLSAVLEDRRCGVFLDEEKRQEIAQALDCQPLYDCEAVETVGASADGDDFADRDYIRMARTVLDAIRQKKVLYIRYTGGKGTKVSGDYLPCRLEYSVKDDKLRMYAVFIRGGKPRFAVTINLGRIELMRPSREELRGEVDIDELRLKARCSEPAVVELSDRRNALERFMLQFASYEKRTRYLDEEDKYLCSLYYDPGDEMELLIRLLSFGPVVKLLSPPALVKKMQERIDRQWELLTTVEVAGGDKESGDLQSNAKAGNEE